MKNLLKSKWGKEIFNVVMIFLGCFLCGISFNLFLVPNNISPAGFSGLCQIISEYLARLNIFIKPSILYFAINAVLFIFAYKIVGKRFAYFTIIGIVAFSLCLEVTSYININLHLDNLLLCTIYGGALMGLGIGIVIRYNGSTGGGDLTAVIIRKKIQSLSTGQIILTIDMIVLVLVSLVNGIESAAYSVLELYISTKVTDMVIDGANGVKAFYIFTTKKEEVCNRIFNEIERGATEIKAKGSYTHKDKDIILCLVNRFSAPRLKRIVKEEDPDAFVFSTNVSEVIGNGFTVHNKQKDENAKKELDLESQKIVEESNTEPETLVQENVETTSEKTEANQKQ